MKLIFIGSGEFGLPTLAWLYENHTIAGIITQPDRPAGRKRRLQPTPVAAWAQQRDLTVFKSENVNDHAFIKKIESLKAQATVICAFGQKLSPEFLQSLGQLSINLHSSLLPKYRGAAPINWAIINGETVTGVSVIEMAQKMDAGAIHTLVQTPIDPKETAGQLHDRLALLGPQAIETVLNNLQQGKLSPQPQDESQVIVAPKLNKADGTVDFHHSATAVRNRVRGLTPWPGCKVDWISDQKGTTQKLILKKIDIIDNPNAIDAAPGAVLADLCIATGDLPVRLVQVQVPGGKPMAFEDFARGHQLAAGDKLVGLKN